MHLTINAKINYLTDQSGLTSNKMPEYTNNGSTNNLTEVTEHVSK